MNKYDLSRFKDARTYEIKYTDTDSIVSNEFVKQLRNSLNMSQNVFASVIGVKKKTVEKWEQGKNPVAGLTGKLLYLLQKRPELINDLYSVVCYNIEISYDIVSMSNENTETSFNQIKDLNYVVMESTCRSNNNKDKNHNKDNMIFA